MIRTAPGRGCTSSASRKGKTAKNRVHLDVRVATGLKGAERTQQIEAHVARPLDAGATIAWRRKDDVRGNVAAALSEGNEFCVC